MSVPLPSLTLKPGPHGAAKGHPWVFRGELTEPPLATLTGKVAQLRDHKGRFLGVGLCHGTSQIAWRRFARKQTELNESLLAELIATALREREAVPELRVPVRRLVASEADNLPGLTIDQFGKVLSVQITSAGMEQRKLWIENALNAIFSPEAIIWKMDAPVRALEGLEVKACPPMEPFVIEWEGMKFEIDPAGGQKTGFYLDQRFAYGPVAALCAGKRVLDACCNQGGFSLFARRAGAREVVAVDSSAEALSRAEHNRVLNGLDPITWTEANIFDWFTEHRDFQAEVVILDPPPFAPNRRALPGALRGYKELNLRGMKAVPSGGILATYCCSQQVTPDMWRDILRDAAADAGRTLTVMAETHQPLDHPIRLNFAESFYLKGLILRVD